MGFLPRVLPSAPTGRLSLGRLGHARPSAARLPKQVETAIATPTADDATLAAGPRKRRRNPTLNVDLRPAGESTSPIARLWAAILRLAAALQTRAAAVRLPSFSRASTAGAMLPVATTEAADAPAARGALANLRASVLHAASATRTRVAPLTARVGARARATELPAPLARLELPAALAPIGRVDRRVLAVLGVLGVAAIYGLTIAEPPATQQVAAAERDAAAPAAKPAASAGQSPTDPVLADPFSQKSINTELRSLRKALEPGDQARSVTVLNDGTMGMNIVNGGTTANIMVRGQDIAIEPLAGEPRRGASLDIRRVHGTAITRFLDEASTTFRLPKAKLGSLRLIENDANPGTFMWIGVWNDPARTTLYADREAQSVGESRPR